MFQITKVKPCSLTAVSTAAPKKKKKTIILSEITNFLVLKITQIHILRYLLNDRKSMSSS